MYNNSSSKAEMVVMEVTLGRLAYYMEIGTIT